MLKLNDKKILTFYVHFFVHIGVCQETTAVRSLNVVNTQGRNPYKLKLISLEEVKIVPFQQ